MDEMRLASLLREADARAPAPRTPADLSGRVRRAARRRAVTRSAGATVAAVLLFGTGAIWMSREWKSTPRGEIRPIARVQDVDALRREVAELQAEARLRSELAERLWQEEKVRARLKRAKAALLAPDPLVILEMQREQSAMIVVTRADHLSAQENTRPQALQEYRAAAELFPRTHWAAVAQRKLKELESGKAG